MLIVESAPEPTILADGVATVHAVPDHAEFWFTCQGRADTLAAAVSDAAEFEERFRKAVEQFEPMPFEVWVSRVAIPDLEGKEAFSTAKLRFPVSGPDMKQTAVSLALLCTKVATLAASLDSTAEGPFLGVVEKTPYESEAIARAVENAYNWAEPAAHVMESRVSAVQRVEILSVDWNRDPDTRAPQPDVGRVSCTARVRVTYTYSPTH